MTCDFINLLSGLNNSKGHGPIKTINSFNRYLLPPASYVQGKLIQSWKMTDSKASAEFLCINRPL